MSAHPSDEVRERDVDEFVAVLILVESGELVTLFEVVVEKSERDWFLHHLMRSFRIG